MAERGDSCYLNRRRKITAVFVVCLLFASVLLVNLAVEMPSNVGFLIYLFAKQFVADAWSFDTVCLQLFVPLRGILGRQ